MGRNENRSEDKTKLAGIGMKKALKKYGRAGNKYHCKEKRLRRGNKWKCMEIKKEMVWKEEQKLTQWKRRKQTIRKVEDQ